MKKSFAIVVGLAVIIGISLFLAAKETVNAEEARIVSIYGGSAANLESIKLEPEELIISKGTVVSWNNRAIGNEVKVIFEDGKKCEDSTDADTGFVLDAKSRYVSVLPEGKTASLRFTSKAVYSYVVEADNQIRRKGTIIVK